MKERVTQENYYKVRNAYDQKMLASLSLKTRKKIHPFLLEMIKLSNRGNGFRIIKIGDARKEKGKEKNTIFAVTHIGKYDIEVVSEAIKSHYYLLSGDFENISGTVNETILALNGVIYVNEYDKQDRALSKQKMINHLQAGGNLMYFPEGTWNLSPNLPMLPCFWGIIDIAMQTKAQIIPIAIEQYGKRFYVNIGANYEVPQKSEPDKQLKKKAITELRDRMATLKWEIWENEPLQRRESISSEYFQEFINQRIMEWPNFSKEEFEKRVFHEEERL